MRRALTLLIGLWLSLPAWAVNLFDAADTRFMQADGQAFDLTSLRGKPVLINFWATWCPPCRDELPELAALHEKTGVAFVGIAVEDNLKFAAEYARVHDIRYPIAGGRDAAIALMQRLGNPRAAMPYTLLVGADGKVLRAQKGRIDPALLEHALQALR